MCMCMYHCNCNQGLNNTFAPMGIGMGMSGFDQFPPDPDAEIKHRKRMIKGFIQAAERNGGTKKTVAGKITSTREDYADKKLHITLEELVDDEPEGFVGFHKHEGWLEAPDVASLVAIASRIYTDRTAVIDRRTGQILEVSGEIW